MSEISEFRSETDITLAARMGKPYRRPQFRVTQFLQEAGQRKRIGFHKHWQRLYLNFRCDAASLRVEQAPEVAV